MEETRQQSDTEKIEELSLLFEISQIIDQSIDIKQAIQPVLDTLATRMKMVRGSITILNRSTGEIFIEAAYGLTGSQIEKGRYKLGEGVTGRVIQMGMPMIVPKVSEEPLFLNKTGARKNLRKSDISFICVPIKLGNETLGAISVDKLFQQNVRYEEDVRLLSIIASMLAQAIKIRQSFYE